MKVRPREAKSKGKTQMSNPLAARFASNTPVMMSADKADWLNQALPHISAGMNKINDRMSVDAVEFMAHDDFWPSSDSWLSMFRPYNVAQGTLTIPIKGMLLHDFGFALGSWATGYTYIVKAFERGMADPEVERIALLMDSPGGEVAGCFDAVDRVFAMRGEKPFRAFVNEMAYSAAFAWASVADKITMTRTAGVGSVGVVTAHVDVSGAMDKMGYKIEFIHAGKHKVDGNPYEGLSAPVKARIQKRIDSMHNIFVSTTARNLGVAESVVRDTEAQTYGAEEALSIGFAHEIGPFDEALAAFSGEPDQPAGDDEMPKPNDQEQATTFSQADLDTARADGKAEGMKEGATAERERVQGILGCDAAKNRPAMSFHLALKTQQTVDEATALLAVSPEEKPEAAAPAATVPGASFDAAMSEGNPNLGAGGEEQEQTSAEATLSEFRAVTGFGSTK